MGYKYLEVPTIINQSVVSSAVEGTDNRVFNIEERTAICLIPEVTNYVREMGKNRIGSDKIFYVARCFRNETTTDSERLREFVQIGVEHLGDNELDCRKTVRKDALKIFKELLGFQGWELDDGPERGLNLYSDMSKTFEITSTVTRKQLLGGGPYEGGAGWALGLERLIIAMKG